MKAFSLPVAIAAQLLSADAFSAVYCGVVNGVQVWDELVPSNCTKALRDMQLSNEHIQSSQKGQRIERTYGAPSSRAVESAVTAAGDYLQRRADEQADAERAAREQMYAEQDEQKRALIAKLSNHILADYPEARIRKADCRSTAPGFGVLDMPQFDSVKLKKAFTGVYSKTMPDLYADVEKHGKKEYLLQLNSMLSTAQSNAYDSFQEAMSISSEVRVKYIQEGQQLPIDCDAGLNNANTCKYIINRYAADYLTTVIGLTEKCVK